ncbi:Retrovirus-related Pol polyprotein from transposon 17.6 [Dictyocoela roeselum]|nr:Retrovirus-related Pol polyprotein from transposon 17.6 [Dictyocoela roeselum]
MSLQEPIPTSKTITIPINCSNNEYKALLDTGSEYNYVSEDLNNRIHLGRAIPIPRRSVELANGTNTHTDSYIETDIILFNDHTSRIKEKFYVLRGLNVDFLLGMDFMIKNNVVLSLKENTIRIDNNEYKLDIKKPKMAAYDEELLEKTRICEISETSNKMKRLIQNYKSNNPTLGAILNIAHEIQLNGNFSPPKKEYSVPIAIQEDVQTHINELITKGIIQKMNTEFISPAFFIRKANDKLRLVIDYRCLNSITVKARNLKPKITEMLYKLKESTIFTKLDLDQGFYQIKIKDEDAKRTGFRVLGNTYVFLRMPFGLTNAPYTFQIAINKVLTGIDNAYCYIDDILVASKDAENHYNDVKRVLKRLKENIMGINFDKCEFEQREINFLGHRISPEGIKLETNKVENLKLTAPKTRKQLEKLIGLINWFRNHVPNLSIYLSSFYDKLKTKDKFIKWDKQDTETLKKIIDEIKAQRILHYPDFSKEFDLKSDASDMGIGSILTQGGKLIGLYSRKFRGAEANYTVIEKDTLAILESLKHFKSIIFASKINIYTENKNLTFKGDLSKRINRWLLILEEYNYILKHISSENNSEADLLSRSFHAKQVPMVNDLSDVNTIFNALESTNPKDKTQLFKLIQQAHILLIHPGKNKMASTLRKYIKIKNLKKIIVNVIKKCHHCQTEKNFTYNSTRTKYVTPPYKRNEIIAIDLKGPIKTTHYDTKMIKKEFYILVITDMFSRYTEIKFIKNIYSSFVCSALEEMWLEKHYIPEKCLSDNGRQFKSKNFQDLMNKHNINHISTSPYNPTGNSVVERMNREITIALRLSRGLSLRETTHNIWKRLNLCNNSTLGHSPYEIFHKKPISNNYKGKMIINDEEITKKIKLKQEL